MSRIGTICGRVAIACVAGMIVAPCRAQVPVRQAVVKFTSGDRKVTIEAFLPTTPGKHPAVLLLHGSGGMTGGNGRLYRDVAAEIARSGYVALIPRYFEKTGHAADKPLKTGEYEAMARAIADAVAYAAEQPQVDGDRLALVGHSMGSNLAMLAAVRDPRIRAVAAWSGAYPPRKPSPKLPALLILHGENDRSTGLDLVRKYEDGLKEQKMPHDVHIYPGAGHNFDRGQFADATGRTVRFFDEYVRDAAALADPAPKDR